MHAMKKLRAFVFVCFCFAAAAPQAPGSDEKSYFPLQAGNEWAYGERSQFSANERITVKVDKVIGNAWFKILNYNGDMHWIRRTLSGAVYEWPLRLWYRLATPTGAQWHMTLNDDAAHGGIACSNGASLQVVSRDETVMVPAGIFSTVHIQFSTSCNDAGITGEWFAEGVGLVKRELTSFAGPVTMELLQAKINGGTIGDAAYELR
ncbi:MAG: hypothetical protein WCQ99_09100 [Pseudomonadota bacterium]